MRAGERPRGGLDRGQKHRLAREHGAQVAFRMRAGLGPQHLVLAPSHEARRGRRPAQSVHIDQQVARRIERHLRAADRHGNHPCAGRDHRERLWQRLEMRQQRGVGIVDAGKNRGFGCDAGAGSDPRQQRPGHVTRMGERCHLLLEPERRGQRREGALARLPEIGVAAERRVFAAKGPGEQPRPILRIGHHPREPRAQAGLGFQQPMQLRARVQPHGQPRRSRQRKIGADRVVRRRQRIRPIVLVIQHRAGQRPCPVQQHQ